MSEHDASKATAVFQRRTYSIDEHALQMLNDEYYGTEKKRTKAIITNGNHESKKRNDSNGSNTSLPRTNYRPSAKSCWSSRSVFAPSPKCNFGPKGTLKKIQNNEQLIVIQDPSSQRLQWISPPTNILIIRKPGPSRLSEFRILVGKLLQRHLHVYIECPDHMHLPFDKDDTLKGHLERCIAFDQEQDLCKIDLLICLGGDGTLLHASSLFQESCPPVLSFSMGSLGFLTPFDFKYHEKILNEVLSGNVAVLLRTRLNCTIIKKRPSILPVTDEPCLSLRANDEVTLQNDDTTHQAVNEVVIDRGPNSYLSNLDLYINDRFITKVQGDGLIISTPTGSTAYAMAAGASMVHPNVPAMVICPICPHSLSFRPIVVPAGIELTVKVSEDTRLTAWLSVDGRNRHELQSQDSVRITTSVSPIPSICRFDQLGDWFESLADILHWNLRESQLRLGGDDDQHNHSEDHVKTQDDENRASPNMSSPESSDDVYL